MAGEFIRVPITSDASQLADDAIAQLQAQWPDWEPNDGDLEVVVIEALAPMAQNAAETAAIVPAAIFRKYGTDLVGTPYDDGARATALTTWTLENPDGHTIPAGTQVDIDGVLFATDADAVIPTGQTTITDVAVTAVDPGVAGNDLAGSNVSPITALDWVQNITVQAPSGGGSDPEDDQAYQDRLSSELQLQAKTLVTARDYVLVALEQQPIGRAVAFNSGARQVTVAVADQAGQPVTQATKDTLAATLEAMREINTTVTVIDPTYTMINVDYVVQAYPGFDATDLHTRVNGAITSFLDPSTWGRPIGPEGGRAEEWINETTVRYLKLVDVIGDVDGVDYVQTLTINTAAADLVLAGIAPLPQVGTITGTVNSA